MDLVFFLSILTFNIGSVGNVASQFFNLPFMKLSWSYNPGHRFNGLACVDLGCFFISFLFFLILSFNIWLVEN
jgi:hypothetical protein